MAGTMSSVSPSHGKQGRLYMLFEQNERNESILRKLYRRAPTIVQQALYFDEQLPSLPCVYILSAGGPIVEGDSFEYEVILREGASAHISTGAATKVAQMRGGEATLQQRIELLPHSYLEYLPEATIPCSGARYRSDLRIVVDSSATLFLSDIYMSGRRHSGERFQFDSLELSCRVERPDATPLFCERQVVEPSRDGVRTIGLMSGWEVFGSVLIFAPEEVVRFVWQELQPYMNSDVALGVHLLPCNAGILCRIVGNECADVKRVVRDLCSLLRQKVKGVPLPAEFPWR